MLSERCQCCYLCKQKVMDRKYAGFWAKGSNFFSSFSFLNGRRIMEMRAGVTLSAWNLPSLQTNKNITLPLGKFSFLKAAWIWALNQWMRLLRWGKHFKDWLCISNLVGGYQLLACLTRTSSEQLLLWLFLCEPPGLSCSTSVVQSAVRQISNKSLKTVKTEWYFHLNVD